MEPVCVINNITIATADDITTLGDDVNIYPLDLSGTINTMSNALNWLEKKQLFQTSIFFDMFSVILGTYPWPLSDMPMFMSKVKFARVNYKLC